MASELTGPHTLGLNNSGQTKTIQDYFQPQIGGGGLDYRSNSLGGLARPTLSGLRGEGQKTPSCPHTAHTHGQPYGSVAELQHNLAIA